MGPKGEWDRQTADFFYFSGYIFLKEVILPKIPLIVRANVPNQTIQRRHSL
jgi:hypothetical protein